MIRRALVVNGPRGDFATVILFLGSEFSQKRLYMNDFRETCPDGGKDAQLLGSLVDH